LCGIEGGEPQPIFGEAPKVDGEEAMDKKMLGGFRTLFAKRANATIRTTLFG
jgi:hypothetical protein